MYQVQKSGVKTRKYSGCRTAREIEPGNCVSQKIWFKYKIIFNKSGEKGAASVRPSVTMVEAEVSPAFSMHSFADRDEGRICAITHQDVKCWFGPVVSAVCSVASAIPAPDRLCDLKYLSINNNLNYCICFSSAFQNSRVDLGLFSPSVALFFDRVVQENADLNQNGVAQHIGHL